MGVEGGGRVGEGVLDDVDDNMEADVDDDDDIDMEVDAMNDDRETDDVDDDMDDDDDDMDNDMGPLSLTWVKSICFLKLCLLESITLIWSGHLINWNGRLCVMYTKVPPFFMESP